MNITKFQQITGTPDSRRAHWAAFEHAAPTISAPRRPDRELFWQHTTTTARGGRAGTFKIGYWLARKA
jgi:hypothetical protein